MSGPEETRPGTDETPAEGGADSRFSIPKDRLAGSESCLNCGTELEGAYCHFCGQPDRRLKRFFPALLKDLADDVLGLDSRVLRTLLPLVFLPGRLTQEYLDGKRSRFTPPMRLYLAASVIFFLLASVLPTDVVVVNNNKGPVFNISDGKEAPEPEAEAGQGEAPAEGDGSATVMVDGKPWDREENPFEASFLPAVVNEWINDEIAESPAKAERIAENPRLFSDKMFEVMPGSLFVLLPLAALLLKLAYPLSKRWYFEHLIFALHAHAFLFLAFSCSLVLEAATAWAAESLNEWWAVPGIVLRGLILFALPLHFLLSLKRVYRQGWILTGFKFVLLTNAYALLVGLGALVVVVMSFVLL